MMDSSLVFVKRHRHAFHRPLFLVRPLFARRPAHRRRACRARRRPRLLPGAPAATRHRSLPPRNHRRGHLPRNGRARPARRDDSRSLRRRGPELCLLRLGRPRSRARRFGLPLDDERAVLAGHGAHQRVRHRSAKTKIPAQAGQRRVDWLLRPDRTGPRLRPRQHGDAGAQSAGRLQPERRENVDHQQPDCRRVCGLGQGRRRRDSRLCAGKRLEGLERPRRSRQGRPARLDYRRDRAGRGVLPRRKRFS